MVSKREVQKVINEIKRDIKDEKRIDKVIKSDKRWKTARSRKNA